MTAADLDAAFLITALEEAEHRPMVERRFPEHGGRIPYWHVHDIDVVAPRTALAEVERLVDALVGELAAEA